jgi:CPA2 family monovalent cation:H+ antiporter-2
MLASHALALVGVPMRRVIRMVQDQRDARYNLLRGYFRGADDDTINDIAQDRLSTVTLPLGIKCVGKPLGRLALPAAGVRIVSLRRSNGKALEALEETLLEGGDTLVLSGKPAALAIAEQKLLGG